MHEIYLIKCKIPISINATAESGYNKINTNSIYEQFKISFNAKPRMQLMKMKSCNSIEREKMARSATNT